MTANEYGRCMAWKGTHPMLNIVIEPCAANPCPNRATLGDGLYCAIYHAWGDAHDLGHATASETFSMTESERCRARSTIVEIQKLFRVRCGLSASVIAHFHWLWHNIFYTSRLIGAIAYTETIFGFGFV